LEADMPSILRKLPKYALHKASGHAKVRYQGRDHYLGKFGSSESKEAYQRFIAGLPKPEPLPPVELPPPPEPVEGDVLLVSEVILHYYQHAKAYYVRNGKPTGEHATVRAALRPLKANFGNLPAEQFTPKKLKKLQAIMIKLDWSRGYINKAVHIVRRAFKWCVSEELIDESVHRKLLSVSALKEGRTSAKEMAPVEPVSDDVIEATLRELPPMIADMVRVQRLSGMRPGELLAMTADAIDRSDPESWTYSPLAHKTMHHGKNRTIHIGPRAIAILRPWVLQAGQERIFRIARDGYRQAIVRASRRAYPHPQVAKIIASWRGRARKMALEAWRQANRAELREWNKRHDWYANRLRHSFATEVRRNFGLEHAQVALGHSSAAITEIYAETDQRKARAVAHKIG
jgi:site-specific recombinase XerD